MENDSIKIKLNIGDDYILLQLKDLKNSILGKRQSLLKKLLKILKKTIQLEINRIF